MAKRVESDLIIDPKKRGAEVALYVKKVDELMEDKPDLFTPTEVGNLMRVDPKTVTRWAKSERLFCIRTLGGHRRYYKKDIRREMILVFMRAVGCTEEELNKFSGWTARVVDAIPAQRRG